MVPGTLNTRSEILYSHETLDPRPLEFEFRHQIWIETPHPVVERPRPEPVEIWVGPETRDCT